MQPDVHEKSILALLSYALLLARAIVLRDFVQRAFVTAVLSARFCRCGFVLRAFVGSPMISLLRDKFVRSENLRRCCFVPMRRNSVFDGLRSSLFKFIQERMSLKVVVSVSRDRAEFVGVKEMYSWVSSAYK